MGGKAYIVPTRANPEGIAFHGHNHAKERKSAGTALYEWLTEEENVAPGAMMPASIEAG
jgi:hypothetical protein